MAMIQTKDRDTQNRKPYQKPQLLFVPLRSEEAVLGFCKNAAGSGPLQGTCQGLGICKTLGS
jgi:hypothetical protein